MHKTSRRDFYTVIHTLYYALEALVGKLGGYFEVVKALYAFIFSLPTLVRTQAYIYFVVHLYMDVCVCDVWSLLMLAAFYIGWENALEPAFTYADTQQ